MLMNAIVINADVQESVFYDQMTGEEKPGYSVELTVLDADTSEKYTCQFSGGFPGLEELKDLKRRNAPNDALRERAAQLKQELPPQLSSLQLEVLKFKGKQAAFMKLVCRFPQVVAA